MLETLKREATDRIKQCSDRLKRLGEKKKDMQERMASAQTALSDAQATHTRAVTNYQNCSNDMSCAISKLETEVQTVQEQNDALRTGAVTGFHHSESTLNAVQNALNALARDFAIQKQSVIDEMHAAMTLVVQHKVSSHARLNAFPSPDSLTNSLTH